MARPSKHHEEPKHVEVPHHAKPTPHQRPVTDSAHVTDFPKRTAEEKLQDAHDLAHAGMKNTGLIKKPAKPGHHSKHVLIHNTAGFLDRIPYTNGEKNADGFVQDLSFTLLPGVNQVDAANWASALQQKMVAIKVEAGHFVELNNKSLLELTPKKAAELVGLCVDKELLASWAKDEKREVVVKALKAQVKLLGPSKQEGFEADED